MEDKNKRKTEFYVGNTTMLKDNLHLELNNDDKELLKRILKLLEELLKSK